MRKSYLLSTCLVAFSVFAVVRDCPAELVEYSLDSELSVLTVSGTFNGFQFGPQGDAIALECAYSGTIEGDLSGGTLTFTSPNNSAIEGLPNGPFEPTGTGVDNYGLALGDAVAAIRDLKMGAFQNMVTEGSSPLDTVMLLDVDGFVDSNVQQRQTIDDPGLANTAEELVKLTVVGNTEILEIPVVLEVVGGGLVLNFTGKFVGNRTVPEPSTALLLGIGLVGLFAVGRRRFRRVS